MFGPLLSAYLTELENYLHRSYGILLVVKGDFFELFWRAYCRTFKPPTIRKSFKATRIYLPNPGMGRNASTEAALNSYIYLNQTGRKRLALTLDGI
jgi:hypothetical protein